MNGNSWRKTDAESLRVVGPAVRSIGFASNNIIFLIRSNNIIARAGAKGRRKKNTMCIVVAMPQAPMLSYGRRPGGKMNYIKISCVRFECLLA